MKKKFLSRLLTMLLVVSMALTLLPVPAMAAYGGGWGSWGFWNWGKDDTTDDLTAQTADNAATYETDNGDFLRIFHLDCGRKYFTYDQINAIIDQLAANHYTHLQLAFGNDALRFLLNDMGVGNYTSEKVKSAITSANSTYAGGNSTDAQYLSEEDMGKILTHAKEKGIEIIPLLNSPGHMSVLISAMQTLGVSFSSSMSLTDTNQVNFIQGLLGLYINYFKNSCTYFNMGADEYSFDKLDSTGYSKFVDYVNAVAKKIMDAGLTPIAFNDGIYYKATDTGFAASAAKINKSITVAYWTASTNYASSETLSKNGFKLLNNNSAWYYVLGDALYDKWEHGQWGYATSKEALGKTSCTTLQDKGTASVVGSVLCLWCDYPSYSYDNNSTKVFDLIATMATSNPDYFKASSTPVEPDKLTLSPSSATLTVGSSITVTANKDVTTWTSNNNGVATIEKAGEKTATVTAVSEGSATIKATTADSETAQVTVNVTKQSAVAKTEEFTITIGGTRTFTQSGNVTGSVGQFTEGGVANVSTSHEKSDATTITYTASAEEPNNMGAYNNNNVSNLIDGNSNTKFWSSGEQKKGQYVQVNLGAAIPVDALRLTSCSDDACTNADVKVSADETTWTTLGSYTGSTTPEVFENTAGMIQYIRVELTQNSNYWWQLAEIEWGSYSNGTFTSMKANGTVTVPAKDETAITFTGTTAGYTEIQIGDTLYKITVNKEDLTKAAKLPIQLWITNVPISVQNVTTQTTGSFYYSGYQDPGGTYAYYVNVQATEAANKEEGVPLSSLVPNGVIGQDNGTVTAADDPNATHVLWKGTFLKGSNSGKSGLQYVWQADMSSSGSDFTYVRYYDGKWAISADRENWTVVTGKGSITTYSDCEEQIIAYYKMRTELTKEVTTDVVDWGGSIGTTDKTDYAVLDFAVKYQSGTRVPSGFPVTGKTRVYNTTGKVTTEKENSSTYRIVNEISVTNETNFEVYMITLTPTTSQIASSLTTSTAVYDYPVDTDAEKVVWVKAKEDLPDDYKTSDRWYTATTKKAKSLTFNADDNMNVGGEPVLPLIEIQEKYGMLITYYIRPVVTEDELVVRYVEESNPNAPFYTYDISVKQGTTFTDPAGCFANNQLTGYTVEGLVATETVYSDLSKMDGVPATYRYAQYTCVKVERSEENKVLTLYYTFTRDASFIADFGLPMIIKPGDINETLGQYAVRIESVTATAEGGTATVDENHNVVFTPNEVYSKTGATLTLKYTGNNVVNNQKNSVTYTVTILPASNVLYEENFLTPATTGSTTITWTKDSANTVTTAQETQKVGVDKTYNVFGYDPAYASSTDASGYWQLGDKDSDKLSYSKFYSNYLSTTFFGNGFDLIGNCGPDTGRVLAILTNEATKGIKVIDVDTRYNDGNGGNDGYGTTTLYQVPLLHVMLPEGTYSVKIYGGGLDATTPSVQSSAAAQSTISTQAMAIPVYSYDAMLESVLQANSLTMADVEYIKADTTAASAAAASTNGIATYAAATATVAHVAGTHVEIDGFRVYRSTDNSNYPTAEQNVTYWNILDVVKGNIVAYREGDDDTSASVSVENYEGTGGPQNEIYLKPSQSVAFKLTDASIDSVQVSLRAVAGASSWNSTPITSNTEMYYTLSKDNNGSFVISVPKDVTGMLAIGNVKLPSSVTAEGITSAEKIATDELLMSVRMAMNAAPVDPEPEQPAVFAPERLDASINTTRFFRNKLVTLTVKASADVAKLTVNGKELRPTNSWLVKNGWSDTYIYVLTDTVKKSESRTYEIIAYDASGVASAAKTLRAD